MRSLLLSLGVLLAVGCAAEVTSPEESTDLASLAPELGDSAADGVADALNLGPVSPRGEPIEASLDANTKSVVFEMSAEFLSDLDFNLRALDDQTNLALILYVANGPNPRAELALETRGRWLQYGMKAPASGRFLVLVTSVDALRGRPAPTVRFRLATYFTPRDPVPVASEVIETDAYNRALNVAATLDGTDFCTEAERDAISRYSRDYTATYATEYYQGDGMSWYIAPGDIDANERVRTVTGVFTRPSGLRIGVVRYPSGVGTVDTINEPSGAPLYASFVGTQLALIEFNGTGDWFAIGRDGSIASKNAYSMRYTHGRLNPFQLTRHDLTYREYLISSPQSFTCYTYELSYPGPRDRDP